MLVFREAKTMPVQQIVVNPVTLQQTNNKDRKVSLRCNAALEIDGATKRHFVSFFQRTLFASTFFARLAFVYPVDVAYQIGLLNFLRICWKMAFPKPVLKLLFIRSTGQ